MKQYFFIFGFFCILVVPFLVSPTTVLAAADTTGSSNSETIIGSNLGLDFYSRIDDAGDALAEGITRRRLNEKRTFGALGCQAPWLASVPIDQKSLERLKGGDTSILVQIAGTKKVNLTTASESLLRQCIVEQYNEIQKSAYQDQATFELVGNDGLYMDGDVENSDYDILRDITRINGVLFKTKNEYTGTKNASSKVLADMLAGKPIAPLFGLPAPMTPPPSGGPSGPVGPPSSPVTGGTPATPSTPTPWSSVCKPTAPGPVDTDTLFKDGFFDTLGATFDGKPSDAGFVYLYDAGRSPSSGGLDTRFGLAQKKDFYHTLPCDGIFCITINMQGGTQNLLGGSQSPSIELILEKHTKMMEPISWSDLSQQKMTNNTYQLPFLNVRFKDKIAGARVFIHDSPQPKKMVEKEATQAVLDAKFDRDVRCAMNQAGLPGDLTITNGFIGAGYNQGFGTTTQTVQNTMKSLGPTEMDTLEGCYDLRMKDGQKEAYNGLSTDLGEIQSFTRAMLNIILEILEVDRKFDNLPSK